MTEKPIEEMTETEIRELYRDPRRLAARFEAQKAKEKQATLEFHRGLADWFEVQGFTIALQYSLPSGFGRADLFAVKVDLKYVVEIKEQVYSANNLSHGVGQALLYRFLVPNSIAVLATYEEEAEDPELSFGRKHQMFQPTLAEFCKSLGVRLLLYSEVEGWKWFNCKGSSS